jgi:hypothetical protein
VKPREPSNKKIAWSPTKRDRAARTTAAFKQIDPKMDAGIDLQREYDAALAMRAPH